MQPLISIIVPVFNTRKYIVECLDSLVSQDMKEIEIICVNDGSTDNVEIELNRYSEQDSRVKIIQQQNKGVAASRNRALSHAIGKYVFFVDSDDFLFPNVLRRLYDTAESLDTDILISKQKIFSDLNRSEYVIRGYNEELLPSKAENVFSPCDISKFLFQAFSSELHGKLFNRSFIEVNKVTFPETSIGEDYFFLYLLLMLSSKIAVCNLTTYNYRRLRNDSLTMQYDNILDFNKSLKALQHEMIAKYIYKTFKDSFEEYIIKQVYLNAKRANKQMQKEIFDIFNKDYFYLFDKNVCNVTPLKELKILYELFNTKI